MRVELLEPETTTTRTEATQAPRRHGERLRSPPASAVNPLMARLADDPELRCAARNLGVLFDRCAWIVLRCNPTGVPLDENMEPHVGEPVDPEKVEQAMRRELGHVTLGIAAQLREMADGAANFEEAQTLAESHREHGRPHSIWN